MITSMLCFVFAALVVMLDQFFKRWIVLTIAVHGEMDLIPGVLGLTHVHNTGAAFSILSDQRWLLVGISFAVCLLLILILLRYNEGFWGTLGLSAVLGGAIGNLIDRLFYGHVVDMFETLFIRFAIFNIADIFITLGGITFCVFYITNSIKAEKLTKLAEEADSDVFDGDDFEFFEMGEDQEEDVDSFEDTEVYAKQQEPLRSEPSRNVAQPENYDMAHEVQDYIEGEQDSRMYSSPEQDAQVYYAPEPETLDYHDNIPAPQELYESEDDIKVYYMQEQGTQETYPIEHGPQESYTDPQMLHGNTTPTLDALGELEYKFSEADLLGEYDVDALLREYGFEDNGS